MTTPNRVLLLATWRHINNYPETWQQKAYRCETGMCFAGWAAALNGGQFSETNPNSSYLTNGELIPDYAQRELGITADDAIGSWDPDERLACGLFDGDNTLDDIRVTLTRILGHDPDQPPPEDTP